MKYLLLTQLLIFCCYSCDSLFIQSRKTVDFRSDTLTKPTNAMRSAMFEAEVGDDVFQEDPTVLKLENRVAQMLNKDSALFFPSGTMSNLCGAMVWCTSRGSEMILGSKSHIFVYEQGGTAQFGGIFPHILPNEDDGSINIHAIEHAIRENNIHYPKTELICIENTHNVCGGRVLSLNYLEQLSRLSSQYQIPIHMDGARVWNAAASLNIDVKEISRYADSLSVCLSKGLGMNHLHSFAILFIII
jgi:threonine aldolase